MPPYKRSGIPEHWAQYDRENAMRWIAGARTPTMFVAGENDGASPNHQKCTYSAQPRQGVKSAYLIYRHEGHFMRDPANKKDLLERVTSWFADHLRPQAPAGAAP